MVKRKTKGKEKQRVLEGNKNDFYRVVNVDTDFATL